MASSKSSAGSNNYRYNGKELNEDFGLNWHDYGARWYDAAIGRFGVIDRFAENFANYSTYSYASNNPIKSIDINGDSTFVAVNDDGTYTVIGGNLEGDDKGVYTIGDNGEYTQVGQSLTTHSFFDDEGNAVIGAIIDPTSTAGQDFLETEIVAPDIGLIKYMLKATGGKPLDFKVRGIEDKEEGVSRAQYVYRGSVTSSGKFGSARDFGNIAAGIVAGRNGLGWEEARLGFDGLQSYQEGKIATEGQTTQRAQRKGLNIGKKLRKKDSFNRSFRPFKKTVISKIDL
ncbi:MAG: RHS repeat-associated core domain-containing protein [Bacteroidota bacterium]